MIHLPDRYIVYLTESIKWNSQAELHTVVHPHILPYPSLAGSSDTGFTMIFPNVRILRCYFTRGKVITTSDGFAMFVMRTSYRKAPAIPTFVTISERTISLKLSIVWAHAKHLLAKYSKWFRSHPEQHRRLRGSKLLLCALFRSHFVNLTSFVSILNIQVFAFARLCVTCKVLPIL